MSDIAYDYDLMDDIKAAYDDCAGISRDITNKLGAMRRELTADYAGLASDITNDLLLKIEEHMRLLETCSLAAAAFVKQSKEDMRAANGAA